MSDLNNSMLETLDAIEGLAYEDDGSLLIPEGDLFKSDVYNVMRGAQIELTRLQSIERAAREALKQMKAEANNWARMTLEKVLGESE